MNELYPIIRRVRRPLLPVDEPPRVPVVTAPETEKPVEPEPPAQTETPDDADTNS